MRVPKSRKIDAKRDLKSHCERRALTAAPLGETGESRFDGLTVLETAKTAKEPKSWAIWAQKASKIHQNGPPDRCKIDGKSRLRRRFVFEALWVALWCQNDAKGCAILDPFGDHFRPKIEKRRPKRHPKIDAEKGLKFYAKIVQKGSQNGVQNQ